MRLWFRVPHTNQALNKLNVSWGEIGTRFLLCTNMYELLEGLNGTSAHELPTYPHSPINPLLYTEPKDEGHRVRISKI